MQKRGVSKRNMKGNPLWDEKFKNVYSNTRAEADLARSDTAWYNNGGKGGRGGKSPPKDKNRRGKLGRLIQAVRVFYFAYIAARSLSLLVSFLARHTPCLALVSCETPRELNPFL